ncbi:MAG: rhodanese-like domain-containing protein [Betaproteobacteria bacterium]|nr:rhodanese-like domain-containing protein [Betaproteobacteria bacterium]
MTAAVEIAEIKRRAAERAQQLTLPYAGALTPAEAFGLMRAGAKLVDVRTRPELLYVGAVPGSVLVEWQTYPGNVRNPDFLAQLAQAVEPDETLMFLCRSAVRSHWAAAAAARAGWPDSYNVLEGFEGDRDPAQHRGTLGGWRKAGLPWVQG